MVNEYSNKERYSLVSILIRIMEADGIIDPREQEFLNMIFQRFCITEREIAEISNMEQYQCEQILKRMEPDKKKMTGKMLNEMAVCDGYLDPRELAIIDRILL